MKRHVALAATLWLTLAATLPAQAAELDPSGFTTGAIPAPHILLPDGAIGSAVVLISDAAGWGDTEATEAKTLVDGGSMVIGIDLPSYMASLRKDDGDCVYMISDIESLSHQVQRKAGNADYKLPIVAGIGDGGALALAMAAQSPAATIGETIAVDPVEGIPLTLQLCTPADKLTKGDRMIYGLTDGPLPNPVTTVFTPSADAAGKAHVAAIAKIHDDLGLIDSEDAAPAALAQTLSDRIGAMADTNSPLGMPIDVLDAKPTLDTMAVIYSGDGGWRDLDKEVGMALQGQGIPVVGIDSLRYFWSERTAKGTATDLARVIAYYRQSFKVNHVLLIGYSFGADILPATYNLLSATDKARIPQLTLMALSHQVDYEVTVAGWLGASTADGAGDPTNDLKSIDPHIVQCIYGTDEEDDACPTLKSTPVEIIPIEGGHHFDEDYPALAAKIVDGLKRRLK